MIHVNNWSNISPFPHLSFRLCAFWWAAEYAVFDLVFLLQIPPWRFSLIRLCVCVWASEEMWVSERESETVLCLRFAETGRGFADKRRGQVTAQRDYHKGREEGEKKKKRGTKDLPGLSFYTSPLSFHWLMAHKWKQTLNEKMKNTLYLRPSALPWDPAQTLLCCQRNGLLLSLQIGPL